MGTNNLFRRLLNNEKKLGSLQYYQTLDFLMSCPHSQHDIKRTPSIQLPKQGIFNESKFNKSPSEKF